MKKLVLGAVVAVLHVVGFADWLSEGFESYAVGDSITNVTGFVCTDGEAAQVAAYGGEYTAYSGVRAAPFAGQPNARYLEVDTDMTAPVFWNLSTFGEPDTSRVIDMTTRFVTLDKPEDAENSKIALWADGAGCICAMAASPLANCMGVSNAVYISNFVLSGLNRMHRVVMNFYSSASGRMSVMQVSVDGHVLRFDGAATAMQGLKSTGWWNNASYPSNVVAAIAQGRVLPCLDAGSVGCNTVRSVGVVGSGAVDDLYVTCPKTRLEGSGTPADPYKVGTATDLKLMRDLLNAGKLSRSAYFALTSDIDMSGEDAWAGIGCSNNMFSGHFDGCNCMISGLKLYASRTNGSEFGGLFSVVSNAVIENVYLENVSTDCPDYFGAAVAGKVYGGTFRNVTATGSLSGTYNLGGIACWATAGGNVLFEACTNCVAVATSYTKAGGFLAYADHACGNIRFSGCWNAAAIRAETDAGKGLSAVGGFIGRVDGYGSFIEAYDLRNIGEVSAAMSGASEYATTVCAGGFIGQATAYSGILVRVFINRTRVDASSWGDWATVCAGGIVGQMGNSPVVISQSFVCGAVTAELASQLRVCCGAFVGYNTAYNAKSEQGLQIVESRCLKDAVPFGRDVAVGGYNAVEIEDNTFARYFYQTEFDVEDNGVVMHFSVTNGMARLTGTEWMSDPVELVTIPDVVGGEPVVEIGDWALCGSTIANIVVPASVSRVGEMAFGYNWELESIRFLGAEPVAGAAIFTNTPPTVVSYFIPTNDGWRASATDEAFISEWPRVGECRPLLQWDGKTPGEYIRVTFDPGEYGYLQGYGIKYAVEGGNVVPPSVRPKAGWFFTGWDKELTGITEEMTVTAQYRTSKSDLHVDAVEIPESATTGDKVTIRWTVGNTGNPNWTGTVVEEIRLVDASNNANTVTVARVAETISVVRDGQTDREYAWEIPLKGLAGEWKVVVETSIGNSGEFGGDNTGISAGTLKITQCPLPDLKIGSVALDRSPANYQPEDTVTVTYVEQNVGTAAAGARAVSLFAVKGETRIRLATESVQAGLAESGEREGTIRAVIPQLIQISGDVNFVVTPNANGDIVELTDAGADADSGKATATIARRLYLAPNADYVRENESSMRYYARRSGETDSAVTLAITASGSTDDVTFPETVKINRGSQTATFYVYPKDNALVDGSRFVDIQLAGDGYVAATHTLEIRDNEVPKLFITMDKTTVREGEAAIKVTITRELVTDEPLTVYLSGLSTSQCSYPTEIKIPAGEASYTFEIEAVNNDTAEIAAASTLRASATGYTAATQGITIEDDDVPSVTLELYPEEISEGAGPTATYAILSRIDETKIGEAITVNLTASMKDQLILQSSVTIPAYTMAVRFPIGVVDNGAVDGDRDVTITGSIYIKSCGCSGQPSSGDVIEATVRIIDNDVPSLSLVATPSTMREGLDHAGDLVLTHNSVLTEDLVVTLSFDTANEIDIPATVTIPAGETQVVIPVRTIDDGLTDGGQLVSVYADDPSGDFKSASTWIQVSDQNLPDLKVAEIDVPTTAVTGKAFDGSVRISNVGFVAAGNDIPYSIHLVTGASGGSATASNRLLSGKVTGGIAPGESTVIPVTVTAPSTTGDYRLAVVIDADGTVSELDKANNTLFSAAVGVSAAYTATVTVPEKVYMPGTPVTISGTATLAGGSAPAANVLVDVYVRVGGMHRCTYSVKTAADGSFSALFAPTATEAGRYSVGACYPGVGSTVEQDYFDILGMKLGSSSAMKFELCQGDSAVRTVTIRNRSKTQLTGLKVTLSNVLEDVWDLSTTLPETLPGDGSVTFRLSATAVGVSPVKGSWDVVPITITCDQGVDLAFSAYLYAQPQQAQLSISPSSVDAKMTVGVRRTFDFVVVNNGKGDSGPVTVSVPPAAWLRRVSAATIDNLKSGETATITLEVYPTEAHNLVLNQPLAGGSLEAACANGSRGLASLRFTPVSDATGSIKVDVTDNATYNQTDGSHPHLAGATVRLSNRYQNDVTVASGVTGTDGVWTADNIPVGDYQLMITCDKHDSYAEKVTINPGQQTLVEKFLKCNLVTTSYDVRKTEIVDETKITQIIDFDTHVPSSKVEMFPPDELPVLNEGESWTFIVHLVNSGSIQAEDVTVTMPEIPGYTFELSENVITLPAKSTVDISVMMRRDKYPARQSGDVRMKLEMPDTYADGDTFTATVVYENTGKSPMPAPIFTISSEGQEFTTDYATYTDSVRLIGLGGDDAPGTLAPGEERSVDVMVKVNDRTKAFALTVQHAGQESAATKLDLRHFYDEDWILEHDEEDDELISKLQDAIGFTWRQYYENMSAFENSLGLVVADYAVVKSDFAQYHLVGEITSLRNGAAPKLLMVQDAVPNLEVPCSEHDVKASDWKSSQDGMIFMLCPKCKNWYQVFGKANDAYTYLDGEVRADPETEVYVICHGNANSVNEGWVLQMGKALYARCKGNALIFAVNWGDAANVPFDDPRMSAGYIPMVAREAAFQLHAIGINPQRTTLIGHSHGAHVAADIAARYHLWTQDESAHEMGTAKFKRFVGLDTSTADNGVHDPFWQGLWKTMGLLSPWSDINKWYGQLKPAEWMSEIKGVCEQVEFYKSSFDLSLEQSDELYGHWNFALMRENRFIEYKSFSAEHDENNYYVGGVQLERNHNYSYKWFIDTINSDSKYANLGYNFDPKSSWKELSGGDDEVSVPPAGVFAGNIRDNVVEFLTCRNGRVPWKYEETVINGQFSGVKGAELDPSDRKSLRMLQSALIGTAECELQVANLPAVVANGATLDVSIRNNSDNFSIPFDILFKEVNKDLKESLNHYHAEFHAWIIDVNRDGNVFKLGSSVLDLENRRSLASLIKDETYICNIGNALGEFALPGTSSPSISLKLEVANSVFGADHLLCENLKGEDGVSREVLLVIASGDSGLSCSTGAGLQFRTPTWDIFPDNNYLLKLVKFNINTPVAVIEEGEGEPPAPKVQLNALKVSPKSVARPMLAAESANGGEDGGEDGGTPSQTIHVRADKDGSWAVTANGWKSYVEDGELTYYKFSLPHADEAKGSIAFDAGEDFKIYNAVTSLHGQLPEDLDRESYELHLEVGTLDGLIGETSCVIVVTRPPRDDDDAHGGGDAGKPVDGEGGNKSCWVPVHVKYYDNCGNERPEYGYTKYVKHGECPGSETLIKTIQDSWREEKTPTGSYDGGPSTGSSGGGTGNFGGTGGGFTYTIDDCNDTTGEGHSGLTPCQKEQLICGGNILLNFVPGSEYVMAPINAYGCYTSVTNAFDHGNKFDKIDAVANCAFDAAGYIPGADWFATGASCVWNITKECKFKYSERKEAGEFKSAALFAAPLLAAEEDDAEVQTDFERAAVLYAREVTASTDWLIEFFGSSSWCNLSCAQIRQFVTDFKTTLDANHELSAATLRAYCPATITDADLSRFVSRWNATVRALAAQTEIPASDAAAGTTDYIRFEKLADCSEELMACYEEAQTAGYETVYDYFKTELEEEIAVLKANEKSVCASVTLQLSQTLAMTREAFEGTLTIFNGHDTVALKDLQMTVSILDEDGNECKDLFVTTDKGNTGAMTGGYVLDGGLSVAPNSSGSAILQFVPSRDAAPTVEKPYSFGGSITYTDPFSGKSQTVKLIPVTLTVSPSPYLKLDYFIQRDVYGDDPFTDDIVEASLPAEMSVLVRNTGAGEARNVSISSVKPSVVLNEKGLAAEFAQTDYTLSATALNGATAYLGLNDVSLGTIAPGVSQIAQWWLTSSIDGHFTKMSASVTPVNSWNRPDTVLVDPKVGMHKLIRSLSVGGETMPWFLTSETDDLYGRPDTVYSPEGTAHAVAADATVAVSGALVGAAPKLTVSVRDAEAGWNYFCVSGDGLARYTVASVTRSDGSSVPVRNAWITSKVFRDGSAPLHEERLHLADELAVASDETYTVTLAAKPTDPPAVAAFDREDGEIVLSAFDSVTVTFSTAIDPATFSVDDLVLRRQGVKIDDLSSLTITAADASGASYEIGGLSALCTGLGRYELVVQCAGIADMSGTLGVSGKAITWSLSLPDAPYIVNAEGAPVRPVKSLDEITVVMSEPVVESSVDGLAIALNGKDVSAAVTRRAADVSLTRFVLSGLAALQASDGPYTLSVNCAGLRTEAGGVGDSIFETSWTRDTVAPAIESVVRQETFDGTTFEICLSEPAGLTVDNVRVTVKGASSGQPEALVFLPPTASLAPVSDQPGVYRVTGLDSVLKADGLYTFTCELDGVTDEAGNAASGSKSVSWSVDTTPPAKVADLAVSSPYGSVETGVYTASRVLTVSGTAPEADVTVAIYAKYVGGDEILLAEPELDEQLRFTADLTLPGDGNLTVIVRLTDAAGISSNTTFEVNVDAIAIDAAFSGLPEIEETADAVVLTFTAEPVEATVLAAPLALARDGEPVEIPGVALAKVSACAYKVVGLDAFTEEYGSYVLSCDLTSVAKVLSGKTGERTVTATWDHVQVDKTAPTVTDILFDGQPASPDLVGSFSSVAVRFSEPVNVPDLAERGLIGQALFFQILDDDNAVLSYLRAADVAWDEATATASWTIDPESIPCGKARLVVEATLVRDPSGNALATTEAFDVISTAKSYTPSVFMPEAARESACPTLFDYNGDGLLDLFVGEKASDTVGKVRVYLNHGTAASPVYDSWTYLKRGADDIELEAAGCSGAQVSFGNPMGLTTRQMVLASSVGEVYVWRYNVLVGDEPAPLELWHDHAMSDEFRPIRTQTFCGGVNGRKILVSGQNSRMFWLGRSAVREGRDIVGYRLNYQPLLSTTGEPLDFPEGQNHTSAVLTDVNGDAIDDLVTGDSDGNVWVYYGTSNARFAASPVRIYENTSETTRSRLAVGDIDGDGVADILVGRRDGSIIKLKGESVLAQAFNFRRYRVKDVEEALSKDLYWEDGTLQGWVSEQTRDDAQAVITRGAADAETILTSKFEGAGTLTFTWSFDGTDDSARFVCSVDGVVKFERNGAFELSAESASVVGAGTHTVVWRVSGGGKAVLRDIAFAPADAASQFTSTSPRPIAYKDIRAFAGAIWKEKGGDYEAAVNATAANGKSVYENCIAGVDSSDPNAAFRTAIEVVNGVPKVSPDPDLGDERVYTFWGRESLETGDWKVITEDEVPLMRFFKVDVRMP